MTDWEEYWADAAADAYWEDREERRREEEEWDRLQEEEQEREYRKRSDFEIIGPDGKPMRGDDEEIPF